MSFLPSFPLWATPHLANPEGADVGRVNLYRTGHHGAREALVLGEVQDLVGIVHHVLHSSLEGRHDKTPTTRFTNTSLISVSRSLTTIIAKEMQKIGGVGLSPDNEPPAGVVW